MQTDGPGGSAGGGAANRPSRETERRLGGDHNLKGQTTNKPAVFVCRFKRPCNLFSQHINRTSPPSPSPLLLLFKFGLSEKLADLSEAAAIRLLSQSISVTAYFSICRISQRGCCVRGAHTVAYIAIPRRRGAGEAAQAVAAAVQSLSSRPLKVN